MHNKYTTHPKYALPIAILGGLLWFTTSCSKLTGSHNICENETAQSAAAENPMEGKIHAENPCSYLSRYQAIENRACVQELIALIGKGADVDAEDDKSNTALHIAAIRRYLEIVQALIEKAADVNVENHAGNTALHITALYIRAVLGHVKIFQEINSCLINSYVKAKGFKGNKNYLKKGNDVMDPKFSSSWTLGSNAGTISSKVNGLEPNHLVGDQNMMNLKKEKIKPKLGLLGLLGLLGFKKLSNLSNL